MKENLTEEIIGLEKKYWTAMAEQDLETALSLTDFPCLVAGAHGVYSVDREEYAKMFKGGQEMVRTFSLDEGQAQVRQVSPDTAVIAYPVQTSVTVKGETREISAIDTSTWVKRGEHWVCAMHTETEKAAQN